MKCDDEALDKFKELRKTFKKLMIDTGSMLGPTFTWYYLDPKIDKVDFCINLLPDGASPEEREKLMDGIRDNFKGFIFNLFTRLLNDVGSMMVPLGYGVNTICSIVTGEDEDYEWYLDHGEIRNHPNVKKCFVSIFVGYGGVVMSIFANALFKDKKVIGFEEDIERPGTESIFIVNLHGEDPPLNPIFFPT